MRALRRLLAVTACLTFFLTGVRAVDQSDEAVAERVLGPQWKQLSRRAGIIFAGTLLTDQTQSTRADRSTPSVELSFRVDRAIVGSQPGEILKICEWTGAVSAHRPFRPGEHLLLFFYPPSRIGFTSPVGGSQGQIALDRNRHNLDQLERAIRAAREVRGSQPWREHVGEQGR